MQGTIPKYIFPRSLKPHEARIIFTYFEDSKFLPHETGTYIVTAHEISFCANARIETDLYNRALRDISRLDGHLRDIQSDRFIKVLNTQSESN